MVVKIGLAVVGVDAFNNEVKTGKNWLLKRAGYSEAHDAYY